MSHRIFRIGRLCVLLGVSALLQRAFPQHVITPVREKWLGAPARVPDTIQLDTAMLAPGSVRTHPPMDTTYYRVDAALGRWIWRRMPPVDSVRVRYIPLPISHRWVQRYPDSLVFPEIPSPHRMEAWRSRAPTSEERLAEAGDLTMTGYIERGMEGGSRLPTVLRSAMAIQLAGTLAPDWRLEAVLNDQSLPGGTGELAFSPAEVDAVYAHLKGPKLQFRLGALNSRPDSGAYFLRFYAQGQGIRLTHQWQDAPGRLFYAFIPGIFQRMRFNAREGFAGPYLLKGKQGETPVAVIPGSEKVYYNGRLLRRGEKADYTIDYLSGLLTFTPAVIPRSSDRVVVEFRYTARHYSRAAYGGHQSVPISSAVSLGVRWYGEADMRGRPRLLQLTPEALEKMAQSQGEPVRIDDGIDSTADSTGTICYAVKDSMGYRIFYLPADPDSARYRVTFSYVGLGKGDYVRVVEPMAGVVYRWIAPVDGRPQGEYAPGIYLPPPQTHRMMETTLKWRPDSNITLGLIGAFSYLDSNTYAARWGKTSGAALRGYAGFENDARSLGLSASYEWRQADFQPVERYRSVEFERKWIRYEGLSGQETWWRAPAAEQLGELKAMWRPRPPVQLTGELSSFRRMPWFRGVAVTLRQTWQQAHRRVQIVQEWTRAAAEDTLDIHLFRQTARWTQQWEQTSLELRGEFQRNRFLNRSDSVIPPSERVWKTVPRLVRNFQRGRVWAESELYVHDRLGAASQPTARLLNATVGGKWRKGAFSVGGRTGVQWDAIKRLLRLAGEADLRGQLVPALRWNLFYWRQPAFQRYETFRFVRVLPGQGAYAWIDHNGDGLPQVDEMLPAQYPHQAEYVRIRVPTDSFVSRIDHRWRLHFYWRPAAVRRRFQWRADMRLEGEELGTESLPQMQFNDSLPGRLRLRWNGRFHLIWPKPGLRVQGAVNHSRSAFPYPYGVDQQQRAQYQLLVRWIPPALHGWEWEWAADGTRDHRDRSFAALPVMNGRRWGGRFRTFRAFSPSQQAEAELSLYSGRLVDTAQYDFVEYGLRLYASHGGRRLMRLDVRAALYYIQAPSDIPAQTAYVGLQGRGPGLNPEFSLAVRRPLGGRFHATLSLEARKPGALPWLLTGQAGLRYVFQ